MYSNQVHPQAGHPGMAPPGQPGMVVQPGHQVIYGQPIARGMPTQAPPVWMPKPAGSKDCPPGLEYLTQIDQILIKQQIELLEVFTTYEAENKYRILNTVGQQVYFAKEDSELCQRQMCLANRAFKMHITDNLGAEVIRAERKFRCWHDSNWCACCDCCTHQIKIESPPGHTVGYVRQRPSFCSPKYAILDEDKNEVLYIEGPCHMGFVRGCPCDVTFRLISAKDGETEIGAIQKQWSNLLQEMFTHADNFGVKFPMDLDVRVKAAIIGATFLIDFMYFENTGDNKTYY